MGPGDERIDVNTAAAVRGDAGFHFGTLRYVQGERFVIELDAELDPGQEVEVRITLQPVGTAFVRALVQRPLAVGKTEAARWVMQTVSIAPDDRARLAAWLHNKRSRGTLSNFDAISTAGSGNRPMQQTSSTEVRAALQRLSQRSLGASSTPTDAPAADPYGLRSDIGTAPAAAAGGRAAMRDALKRAATKPPLGAAPPQAAAPPQVTAPRAPAVAPPDAPFTPTRDPSYASTATRSATWLEVRWSSSELFAKDTRGLLVDPTLHLQPLPNAPLPDRDPVRVMLRHAELVVECGAVVKAHSPYGASYRLTLGDAERAMVTNWLRLNGR